MMRVRSAAGRALFAGLLALMSTGCGFFGPPQPIFTAHGRVVDTAGKGVPGAVVTDGQVSAFTDEGGQFSLLVFERVLSVAKPGKSTAMVDVEADVEATITLAARAERPVIAIDSRWASRDLDGLRATLGKVGRVTSYAGGSLAQADVLVMITPGVLGASEQLAITSWIRGGGRLVLCGEWGGYPDQDLATLNALAEPAGMTFPGATVRNSAVESLELRVGRATPASLAAGMGSAAVTMFAASNLALSGQACPVLTLTTRAYAVLATSTPPVLAAVGPLGLGKVFALGDSSLWRDEDSEGGGTPNVKHGGNARFAQVLVGW